MEEESKTNQIIDSLFEWYRLTDSGLRLRMGELTAQEIRSIRAVLNNIVGVDKEDKSDYIKA